MTDLQCQMAGCFVSLDRFGRVSEFDRMRALRNWPDLAERVDQAAFSEALDRLNGHPVPLRLPHQPPVPERTPHAGTMADGP